MRTLPLLLPLFVLAPRAALAQGDAPPPAPPAVAADKPRALVEVSPEGLTADKVAERAAATSYSAKASEEALRGAAARMDAAWTAFLPRLSGLARYTRLSELTPPNLTGGYGLVVTSAAPGTPNPPTVAASGFSFPVVLNNWTFQGTLAVPISDYFLRINQSYTAATLSRDAARFDVAAARAKASADGRVAYYTWLRARGAQIVAQQALADQKTHLTDARNIFTVGRASKADVLRAETAVASAELAVERSKNLVELTEKQVRVAMHDASDAQIVPGEGIDAPVTPFQGNLQQLTQEGLGGRMEVKSIDANAEAASKSAAVQRAGMFPQVSGAANVTLANPNARVFPQAEYFFTTWDASIQLTWSPNDVLTSMKQGTSGEAQAAQLLAQKEVVRDGITLEVTQAYQQVKEAEFALETGKRELTSAQEAYRVAHELFLNGAATSTTLTDAETELTRSRLDLLNAQVDARVARVRLEHAVGRDARLPQ